jgi:hypothetical protein
MLVFGWVKVFGESETALRSLSALAGVARIELDQFTIVRYHADELVPMSKAQLMNPSDVSGALVLAPTP